ncbi:ABC transporter permease [Mesorhizobium sp. VNQ89]|uniref:ABC transporter permease n=1 Tax=Mesorhizobium quangtriensis TaxID=3157709 RepID=UPI0032B84648
MTLPANATRLPHTVSDRPFDPEAIYQFTDAQKQLFEASQRRLMWWKFRRHKPALISGIFLGILYISILFSEILAPYNLETRNSKFIYAPPQRIHLMHDGQFIGPFVYGFDYKLNMQNLKREYVPDPNKVQPLRFFCSGETYKFWGLIEGSFRIVCPAKDGTFFFMGTDRLGRDVFSRIIYGARISLTIGLLGVGVSLVLGIVIGGLAGYYGGLFDTLSQRLIEVIQSLPSIPLWLALAAILPITWSPIVVYFGITVILGLLDWTGLARTVRSKLLALREEDYVSAAQVMGASDRRIVFRHLVPGFASHLIATATIAIPTMILGETTLSFLGLGLRAPITSWGVLLTEAQNINAVALYPWLLWPVVPVILVVLAYNFFGDGLRDAADPYK